MEIGTYKLIQKQFGNKYTILKQCGSGAYSQVFKCQNENGNFVAIKVLSSFQIFQVIDTKKAANIIDILKNETTLLENCDNENVIKLYESSKSDEAQYLVLEDCEMDLMIMMTQYYNNKVPENIVVVILKQLMNGLSYLHKNKIIHRDLKLQNIGVVIRKEDLNNLKNKKESVYDSIFQNASYKLLDFGFAKQLVEDTKTFIGTFFNMAPEVIQGILYSFSADIYSLGVCLYQLITGQYPYQAKDLKGQYQQIKNQKANFDTIKDQLLRNTIQQMLQFDVTTRLTFQELHQSELVNSINQISEFCFINSPIDDLQQSLINQTQAFSIIQCPNSFKIEKSENEQIIDCWKKQRNICTCIFSLCKKLRYIIETFPEMIQLFEFQNEFIEHFKYYSKLVEKLLNKLKKEVNEKSYYYNIQLYIQFRDSLQNFELLNREYTQLNPTQEYNIFQKDDIDDQQNLQSTMQIKNQDIFNSISKMLDFTNFHTDEKLEEFHCNCYLLQCGIIILQAETQYMNTISGDDQFFELNSEDFHNNPYHIQRYLNQLMEEKKVIFEGVY